ncbi:MAG: GAF domain-containing sensor histidine kinase [Anaerolineales bacterium]|nr:GAF domain-containing sensor histidine kinase [Anaerolineales bacterium]
MPNRIWFTVSDRFKALLAHYKLFIALLAGLVVLGEIYHHNLESPTFYRELAFWLEIIVYGLLIPGLVLLIIEQVERRTGERDHAIQALDQQFSLTESLAKPLLWEKLIQTILEFPTRIFPCEAVFIHLYDSQQERFTLVGSWGQAASRLSSAESILSPEECVCLSSDNSSFISISGCHASHDLALSSGSRRYCLPLAYGDLLVGLIHFDLPSQAIISPAQAHALVGTAPEIALALNNARLQHSAGAQEQTLVRYRQQIAQDLHDTLGQNLAYLRLKLDQLSSDDTLQSIAEIGKELNRMREVADEAYRQIRSTLDHLEPAAPGCLATALQELAEQAAARAGFTVETTSVGQSVQLSAFQRRQILYIFREALNNIEKHANASKVSIRLTWLEERVAIQIQDDGRGFTPQNENNEIERDRHFGLAIMQERAQDINGHFHLESTPGVGTKIELVAPFQINVPAVYSP